MLKFKTKYNCFKMIKQVQSLNYNQAQYMNQGQKQKPNYGISNSFLHFAIGGFSGMFATCVIQPIDTIKVQIQVISERDGRNLSRKNRSMFQVLKTIYQEKGFKILYRGLDSAIFRQLFYASARLGSYNWAVERLAQNNIRTGLFHKVGLSIITGIFGAIIGNPFDVALIRRQATVTTGKKAYANTFDAFRSIIHEEGITGLWRGIQITMLRVLLINIGQLAGNQIITEFIKPLFRHGSILLPNISAILASFLTSFLSLPADNIKVKLQKQSANALVYSGIGDCFKKTITRQGIFRLWVGFPIYLIRGTPHSFILIRTQQFLKQKLLSKKQAN